METKRRMKTGGHKSNLDNNYVRLSCRALRLVTKAIDLAISEKIDANGLLQPRHLAWVLLLLANMNNLARSIILLCDRGEFFASEILRRAFTESLINILFILDEPSATSEDLLDLYLIDHKQEIYAQLESRAKSEKISIDDLIKESPKLAKHKKRYDEIKDHPVFSIKKPFQRLESQLDLRRETIIGIAEHGSIKSAEQICAAQMLAQAFVERSKLKATSKTLRRWKDIKMQEKERRLFKPDENTGNSWSLSDAFEYLRLRGNSYVHSTGVALSRLMGAKATEPLQIKSVSIRDSKEAITVCHTTLRYLLVAARQVMQSFYLPYKIQDRITVLLNELESGN